MYARRSLAAVAFIAGCASGAKPSKSTPTAPAPSPATSASAAVRAAQDVGPSLDALAARQPRLAPGMRELARGVGPGPHPLPLVTRDTCVRIAFGGAGELRASLVTAKGDVLEAAAPTRDGVIGAHGPVCFHANAAPELTVDGDAGIAYVVWGSP